MSGNMFRILESTWDQSGHRGWSALASFTMQVFGMGLLLLIPLLTIQGPPKLQWLEAPILMPPPAPAPPTSGQRTIHRSNFNGGQLQQPQRFKPPSQPRTNNRWHRRLISTTSA